MENTRMKKAISEKLIYMILNIYFIYIIFYIIYKYTLNKYILFYV